MKRKVEMLKTVCDTCGGQGSTETRWFGRTLTRDSGLYRLDFCCEGCWLTWEKEHPG